MRLQVADTAKTRPISTVSILALAGALLALAGCGGSSSSSYSAPTSTSAPAATAPSTATSTAPASTAPASTAPATATGGGKQALSLAADPGGQLKYDTTSLTAKAGKVSIGFTNMSSLGHNVTVASASGAVVGATATFQGASKTLTLSLKPGTYTFYCSVPGHRASGMQGTLTVQ